ncbi:MAG: lipocalin-like domain-containing protein [Muribaculum sp.]|nr:lipocalin-like domain-containing protein [Muribaculum sp.]
MIRHILICTIIAITAIFTIGCTHNNGDIGPYFGTWKLLDIEVDGLPLEEYKENIFWQFQSDVFCMRGVLPHHDTDVRWGSWEEASDDILILNFSHHDDSHETGSTMYSPLPLTGLEATVNRLDILYVSNSKMTLTYRTSKGAVYCYRLKKW